MGPARPRPRTYPAPTPATAARSSNSPPTPPSSTPSTSTAGWSGTSPNSPAAQRPPSPTQRARPPEDHPARTTADAGQRFPGAELTRYIQARDRTCRFPMCTVPAVACHLDHTHDWLLDGPTQADNLGALSVGDHLRKHDVRIRLDRRTTHRGDVRVDLTHRHHPHRRTRALPAPATDAARERSTTASPTPTNPKMQRPWRPRTDKHGHITDAARTTLDEIDRRRRARRQTSRPAPSTTTRPSRPCSAPRARGSRRCRRSR